VKRLDGICPSCNDKPRMAGYSYCATCRNTKQRERYNVTRDRKRREARPGYNPNACNCGNPRCNGLMCERADAVALEATECIR
jgi:hypothetical protein